MTSFLRGDRETPLTSSEHFGAAFGAGAMTTVLTNPAAVVRTKSMMLNQGRRNFQRGKSALQSANSLLADKSAHMLELGLEMVSTKYCRVNRVIANTTNRS